MYTEVELAVFIVYSYWVYLRQHIDGNVQQPINNIVGNWHLPARW